MPLALPQPLYPGAPTQSGQQMGPFKFPNLFGPAPQQNNSAPLPTDPNKPRAGSAGYEANPNLNPTAGLGFDQDIQNVTTRILQAQERANQFNIKQKDAAYNTLLGPGGLSTKIGGYYDQATQDTQNALPLNPFTDALKTALLHRANDQITTDTQGYLRQASEQLAARGLSSGGSTGQTAAGGIQSQATGQRVSTEIGLNQGQLEYNTQSNEVRQNILNDLISKRAALESQVTEVGAGIKAGNVRDPQQVADELGAAFGLQISRENQTQLMDWIKTQEPSFMDKFLQGLPALAAALFPGGPAVLGGVGFTSNLLRA